MGHAAPSYEYFTNATDQRNLNREPQTPISACSTSSSSMTSGATYNLKSGLGFPTMAGWAWEQWPALADRLEIDCNVDSRLITPLLLRALISGSLL